MKKTNNLKLFETLCLVDSLPETVRLNVVASSFEEARAMCAYNNYIPITVTPVEHPKAFHAPIQGTNDTCVVIATDEIVALETARDYGIDVLPPMTAYDTSHLVLGSKPYFTCMVHVIKEGIAV